LLTCLRTKAIRQQDIPLVSCCYYFKNILSVFADNFAFLPEFSFLSEDAQKWLADDDSENELPLNSDVVKNIDERMQTSSQPFFPTYQNKAIGKYMEESAPMNLHVKDKNKNQQDDSAIVDRLNRVLFTSSINPNTSILTTTHRSPSTRNTSNNLVSGIMSPKPITPSKVPAFDN
jgi:hypothetical protein